MSKGLKNAVATLRVKGVSKQDVRKLVGEYLDEVFVNENNLAEHFEDLIELLPGWQSSGEHTEIVNAKNQRVSFGPAMGGGICAHQYGKYEFRKTDFTPQGFTTKSLSLADLATKVLGLEKRLRESRD